MLDLQKASMLKRISAYILDVILLVVMITGFAFLLSAVTGFDSYSEQLDEIYGKYEEKYNISIGIDYEEYQKLSEEDQNQVHSQQQQMWESEPSVCVKQI